MESLFRYNGRVVNARSPRAGAGAPGAARAWAVAAHLVTNPDDCNLACPMCECGIGARPPADRGVRPGGWSPALARRVLDERRGSALREVIPSTMGEPLLWTRPRRLVDLCAEERASLNVTTNGTFPGRGAAAWAARLRRSRRT